MRYLITAALPYSNGRLHVGHIAGAYLPSDIYVRYLRLKGHPVKFICGSDDHGVAILLTAEKQGKSPAEVAAYFSDKQKEDFAGLGIEFDIYGSTSRNKSHERLSQEFFLELFQQGFFEKKTTKQFYDEKKGIFLPDRFVKGTCGYCAAEDQNGDQCENCGKVLDIDTLKNARSVFNQQRATVKETVHWFLDLGKMQSKVSEWLEGAVLRENTRRYVKSLLEQGLVKRSMTRDLNWGVPVPLPDPEAKGKVLYVWFDAPIGYISNTLELLTQEGQPSELENWWHAKDCRIFHFIGEDNTIFHCVIWIAMLSAAENKYSLPSGVIVNQFLNIQFPEKEEEKISKSRGTAVWIEDYLAEGGDPDVLRYYLTAIAPEKGRTVYKPEDLLLRKDTDLANTYGNFIHRVLSFTHKYVGPKVPQYSAKDFTTVDIEFRKKIVETHESMDKHLENFSFKSALEVLMDFARDCNKYIDEKQPWVSRKTDMAGTQVTLGLGLEAIKFLAIVSAPFLPFSAKKLQTVLGLSSVRWADAVKALSPDHPLGQPQVLFQKSERPK